MKGIILAGGKGTRLYPMTQVISKQLLPIYDKPLIYYPLSILLLAEITEILIISTERDIVFYKELLKDGEQLGIKISYQIQKVPKGLAEAFLIGEKFIGDDSVCLILGDNIFYGQDLSKTIKNAIEDNEGATIFGYPVNNPIDFGVVEFDPENNVIGLEEKPLKPKSNYAIPGLYIYNNDVIKIAKSITPSDRGELEITSVNENYLSMKKLKVKLLSRGVAWLDTGTPEGLMQASEFVEVMQKRQGFYISCIEEIAWRKKFIDDNKLKKIGEFYRNTAYGQYLLSLIESKG